MVRHSLLYLLAKDEAQPRLPDWPEIGTVDFAESEERYLNNFCMMGPFDINKDVISVRADDTDGLRYVKECVKGTHVLAVRGTSEDPEWYAMLNRVANNGYMAICAFDRHEILSSLGRKAYWDGIELLQRAADYLRGPGIQASPAAMKTETVLTRAIESLCTTGYGTPKR